MDHLFYFILLGLLMVTMHTITVSEIRRVGKQIAKMEQRLPADDKQPNNN